MGSVVKYTNIGMVTEIRLRIYPSFYSTQNGLGEGEIIYFNDLANEVFDDCTKEVIKNCRVICDLKSLLEEISQKVSVMFGLEEPKTF